MPQIYHRRNVKEQQVGTDRMVFDKEKDCVHVLNHSAAFIWDCLKESTTVSQIEQSLRRDYDVSGITDITGTILRVLNDLTQKGLVVTTPHSDLPGAGLGAEDPDLTPPQNPC